MKASEIGKILKSKIDKAAIPSHVLLDKFRVIDEYSRRTAAYTDPRYAPFYYYLGNLIEPKTFAEFGLRLGLLSGSLFKSCKTVKTFFAFQPKIDGFYSSRIPLSNIRAVYKNEVWFHYGSPTDSEFIEVLGRVKWDLVTINDEGSYDSHRQYFDVAWDNLATNGFIVSDYAISHRPAKDAYIDFCKMKNREPILLKTRYGTGIIQK